MADRALRFAEPVRVAASNEPFATFHLPDAPFSPYATSFQPPPAVDASTYVVPKPLTVVTPEDVGSPVLVA